MQSKQIPQSQQAIFCTLGDYITARLTHERPYTHITNAASTGLTDLTRGGWNQQAIGNLGLDRITFPEIGEEDHLCGYFLCNGHKVPIFPAVGDHQAAVLGAGISPLEDLSINIGTGSQIGMIDTELRFGNYQTRPFFEGGFIRTIPSIPAGRALNVLVDFIGGIGRDYFGADEAQLAGLWKQIEQKAAEIGDSDLEVKISFFESSLKESRGLIANISESNLTVDNLFYSAYVNMAENYWKFYRQLEEGGPVIQKIILSGGLARKNKVLCRLIAEKFGIETKLCLHTEDTMVGLFQIAMKCAGICRNLDDARGILNRIKVIE
jgi:sugar (pentulose or hexulose) kinase